MYVWMIVVISEKAYDLRMKYSFNTPDTVMFVFTMLALFVVVQAIPDLDYSDGQYSSAAEALQEGESYIAPITYSKNNYINEFSKLELQEIETSYVLGKEVYGPELMDIETIVASIPEETESTQPTVTKVAPKYAPIIPDGTPKIAIIIDDMGVSHGNSLRTIDLNAPLTLAFLPYAEGLSKMTEQASDAGHELMIHMPMQAMTNPVSLGPIAIKSGMDKAEIRENMQAAFKTFEGYEGLNNHMGSKVTQDKQAMSEVMKALKKRDLFFVDSRTISSSIAAETAREYGLPVAVRDVFLDHEETPEFVMGALRKLEKVAVRKGHAIAIGHPKRVTIEGLQAWLPDAQSRGFEIVHVSELLERPANDNPPRVAALSSVADTEPAAGDAEEKKEKPVIVVSAKKAVVPATTSKEEVSAPHVVDPNSAQARESILKTLLGQQKSE